MERKNGGSRLQDVMLADCHDVFLYAVDERLPQHATQHWILTGEVLESPAVLLDPASKTDQSLSRKSLNEIKRKSHRAMFSPGPSWMLVPLPQNSSPIAVPHSIASSGSQDAAMFSVDGHCVALPAGEPSPKPCGPLSHRKYARPQAFPQPLFRV